ncbi:MAG: hypothetical protein ABJD24_09380 [Acidimicrobiales bacterium]
MARVVREPGYEDTTLDPPPPYAVAAPPPVVVRETPVVEVSQTTPAVAVVDDTVTSARFPSPTQILVGAVAGALLVFGIIAIARGGFSGSLNEPSFTIVGIRHTTAIGLVEIAAGFVLGICAMAPGLRGLSGFLGVLMVAGGIAVVVDLSTRTRLHTDRGLGWLAILFGAVVVLSSLFAVRRTATRRVVTRA